MLGNEDARENIKEAIREVHKQALAQEHILGHPSKLLLPAYIIFVIIAFIFFYKAYTSSVILGPLTYLFYLWGAGILIGVIVGFKMSYGYSVLITPKQIFVYQGKKEIFSAPLSKLKFKYDMKLGYTQLVLKNEENDAEFIITSLQFKEINKVVDKLKKVKKFYSMRKR